MTKPNPTTFEYTPTGDRVPVTDLFTRHPLSDYEQLEREHGITLAEMRDYVQTYLLTTDALAEAIGNAHLIERFRVLVWLIRRHIDPDFTVTVADLAPALADVEVHVGSEVEEADPKAEPAAATTAS